MQIENARNANIKSDPMERKIKNDARQQQQLKNHHILWCVPRMFRSRSSPCRFN